ncbi:hypothetical protein [Caulobacter sp.]|uniref:hypothetical protein n=1 Tax=Caulobacter sp. TaxID=78 RepID=UPI0031DE15A6
MLSLARQAVELGAPTTAAEPDISRATESDRQRLDRAWSISCLPDCRSLPVLRQAAHPCDHAVKIRNNHDVHRRFFTRAPAQAG